MEGKRMDKTQRRSRKKKNDELHGKSMRDPEKRRKEQKRDILEFLGRLAATVIICWAVFTFVYGIAPMRGESMYPRIRDGDLMLFFRMEKDYHIGDVVTFRENGRRYTGRIVAMQKDAVDMTETGELLVNGSVQQEEIFYPTQKEGTQIAFPCTVEEGCVFLLSDFRTNGNDSRSYGTVSVKKLDGKVITILRRRGI